VDQFGSTVNATDGVYRKTEMRSKRVSKNKFPAFSLAKRQFRNKNRKFDSRSVDGNTDDSNTAPIRHASRESKTSPQDWRETMTTATTEMVTRYKAIRKTTGHFDLVVRLLNECRAAGMSHEDIDEIERAVYHNDPTISG